MAAGSSWLLPLPTSNIPPIVLETSRQRAAALGLSALGVPPARGAGQRAISQWLWASTLCVLITLP